MSAYIGVAILAWVLYGVVSIMDKLLLQSPIKSPVMYAFYTGAFSIFTFFILLPFAHAVGIPHFLLDLLCGAIFLAAQFFLFKSIAGGDVSRVVPVTGALVPIFSLIGAAAWLGISLTVMQLVAFVLLIAGTFLMQFRKVEHYEKGLLWPVLSSICFATYYVLAKVALQPFGANIAYTSLGNFFAALLLLFVPQVRAGLSVFRTATSGATSMLFLSKEALGGGASLLLNYSVSIGNPAIANALQGIEYVTIFFIAIVLSKLFPKLLREDSQRKVVVQEIVAILLIFVGLFALQF